jgi:Lrp/AsnC family leucine-responsive transcriptional regulator
MSDADGDGADLDIDAVDRAILTGMLEDGRAGPSRLAERAGVATSTATKRRQRLEARGIVGGYRPEVDYQALGYDVTAVFRLAVAGHGLAAVVSTLQANRRMVSVYEVTGETDVIGVGIYETTEELRRAVTDLLRLESVREVETSLVLETVCGYDPPPLPDPSE